MVRNAILLGTLLSILGTGTFALVSFDPTRVGALIPAFFGALFLVCGVFAQHHPLWKRQVLLGSGFLAAFTMLFMTPGLLEAIAVFGDAHVANPTAAMEQGIAALLCGGYLIRGSIYYIESSRRVAEQA